MTGDTSRAREAAAEYLRRGWAPIDVPYGMKNPNRREWQHERLTNDDLVMRFNGRPKNVSVLNGEPSGGLLDVDLDWPEARALARQILPSTGAVFGRPSAPRSHWLYVGDPLVATDQTLVDPVMPKGEERAKIVELRSTGSQTVFPPSWHGEAQETLRWYLDGDPAVVDGRELLGLVRRVAAAALLARYWPPRGARHDVSLALAGGLLRAGWDDESAEEFITNIARAAGDEEARARGENVTTTQRRLAQDGKATGWPRLAGLLDTKVVDKVREWLDVHDPDDGARIVRIGKDDALEAAPTEGVSLTDFRAYMPDHRYIFMPSRELWLAASINGRLRPIPTGKTKKNGDPEFIPASAWLDRNRPVEQMTWAPGKPLLIENQLIDQGGWIDRPGITCFNLYRAPTIKYGNPDKADRWIEHVSRVYPTEVDHILSWLAHRVQRPAEKINHALVLGGAQGVGKDTLLEPVKHAVGPWNFAEVSPIQLLGRFNGFVKSVILRVSEVRDLGDAERSANRYSFYEHMKVYTAAPPDVLRCDEKHLHEIGVPNVCGVIVTTNHKTDGLYLPAEDRRHFIAWSDCRAEDFDSDYWSALYRWYQAEGYLHVAAYLATLDISEFDPKMPPPKTAAFWDIVDAGRAPEDAELTDILELRFWPAAITIGEIASYAGTDLATWLQDRKNSRQIPYRLESVGYVRVRNDATTDGRWKVDGKNQIIYGRSELSDRERIAAARELAGMWSKR